ncbi:MAG: protein kinase [Desulfobacterium sp.]|nr:protein kinase [Desulfobacterium sp.]
MEYNFRKNTIELSKQNTDNYVSIDGRDKYLSYIGDQKNTGKGGNSFIFQVNDFNDEENPKIIKFCKYYTPSQNQFIQKQHQRFDREIRALKMAEKLETNDFLVKLLDIGTIAVPIENSKAYKKFKYYTMEKADYDLGSYLANNPLNLNMKIQLCLELIEAFIKLHSIGIYHRDIKPDNIFFVNNRWKIGDLGLMAMRDEDSAIDYDKEKIGPFGFLSPEALNKAIGNRNLEDFSFNCDIDDKSDVFQIGKVLWFIIQGEVPSGQLVIDDFKEKKVLNVFQTVIKPALQFAKDRRPSFLELKKNIIPTCEELKLR